MNFLCCLDDTKRRAEVRHQRLTGLDWLEVEPSQKELRVGFVGKAPDWIGPENVRISGGVRERNIKVMDVRLESSDEEDLDDVMVVAVDRTGDYSTYRLEIVERDESGHLTGRTPHGFDLRYSGIDFSFKADCRTDQDPLGGPGCPEEETPPAAINYLAKDYQSFRQLMLDRMALTAPGWTERHAPDLGITLVELLAYAADDLSYYQDAVATEAYLGTARLRRSVRRHVRLVDYRIDEGRSARGWARLILEGSEKLELDPADLMFATDLASANEVMVREPQAKITSDVVIFEPSAGTGTISLWSDHNEIDFYDWGASECCLLKGATRATLADPGTLPGEEQPGVAEGGEQPAGARTGRPTAGGNEGATGGLEDDERDRGITEGKWHKLHLAPGDVLVLAERLGPGTGLEADADPHRRHAVRLTAAEYSWDPLAKALLVEIEWCPEDALPFPFCLSATTGAPECKPIGRVSVAYGNILPVDHGRSIEDDLEAVLVAAADEHCPGPCEPAEIELTLRRYRPELPRGAPAFIDDPHGEACGPCGGCGSRAASSRGAPERSPAVPAVILKSRTDSGGDKQEHQWLPRPDLLDSGPDERHFVVERDDEGGASLRFGDGIHGRSPDGAEHFKARYRIGGGSAGNIGANTFRHIIFRNNFPDGVKISVGNPLPMLGGRDPESAGSARLRAPFAFRRRLERAITADDYAAIVMRDFPALVQRAAAVLRSTGVRTEVQVAIDPRGRAEAPLELLTCIERHLERFRRIGHDVRAVSAKQVPLDLAVELCVQAGFVAEDVGRRVREKLAAAPGGFFSPDALSFGDGIAVSKLIAAVHSVEGVADAKVTVLNRLFDEPDGELESGLLAVGPGEIARLDQDPDAPENGRLVLTVKGGR
jgi:hypothetical protein